MEYPANMSYQCINAVFMLVVYSKASVFDFVHLLDACFLAVHLSLEHSENFWTQDPLCEENKFCTLKCKNNCCCALAALSNWTKTAA